MDEISARRLYMLAYVFWHWKKAAVPAGEYEARQRAFHAALAAAPSPGFHGSFSVALSGAPWAAEGGDAYGDWYLVEDFGALGALNDAAVSGPRAGPHHAAAEAAAGGTAGLYALRLGEPLLPPRHACWLSKPPGMSYDRLFTELTPVVEKAGGALWMRQMTLGPAREFSLHAASAADVPAAFDPIVVSIRRLWPEQVRA
jgi:hypothetical protein